jgi:undecaprenyl-diphosphatase
MIAIADLIGAHALLTLLFLVVLLLLTTALLWRGLERYGESLRPGTPVLIGCAVAAGCWLLFSIIVAGIDVGASLGQFDTALSASLHRHLSPSVLQPFAYLTHLGDRNWLIVVGSVGAVVLFALRKYVFGVSWVIAGAGGGWLNQVLKALFERARPLHDSVLFATHGYSFPSAHAQGSTIIYGMLAYLLVRHTQRRWHLPVALMALGLLLIIGASRIILQVHYFSDVIAGFVVAAAWLAICIAGTEIILRSFKPRTPELFP